MRENAAVENPIMKVEEEAQRRLEDLGPYFQLVYGEPEDSETGWLKEAVQALEEKVDQLSKRISAFEEGGEEVGSSSSEDGYEREWRWESGRWCFKAPLVKGFV